MRRIRLVAIETFKKQIKGFAFWFMVLFPFVMGAIFAVVIPKVSQETFNPEDYKLVIDYKDENNYFNKRDVEYMSEKQANKALKDEKIDTYAKINIENGIIKATIKGDIDADYESIIDNAQKNLNYDMAKLNKDQKDILKRKPDVKIEEAKSSFNVISFVVIIFLFIVLTNYSQVTLVDIAQAKGTKRLEFIFSSVTPEEHFAGKILGIIMTIAFHLLVYVLGYFALKGVIMNLIDVKESTLSEVGDMVGLSITTEQIIITIAFVILGILLYTMLAAILASLTKRVEDASKYAMPLTLLMLVAYFIGIMPGASETATVKVLSYIPFWSMFLMPDRMLKQAVSMPQVYITLAILLLTVIIVYMIGSKIYKKYILNY
ncbi:MAG: ABC transporter permease [Tissierellia bacterium]|nr:ABC transporter permease [Tissierellia bacterium]